GWLEPSSQKVSGRPVDILLMKDGSMLVSDDKSGLIYRISYKS
ncbi:MAG: sorbosone dehydrogenase family protein, partial [Bacteroidota bacterium]